MTSLFILVFFFLAVVFVFSALVAAVRFNIDLHRFKQSFKFAGPRSKFINFLLEKSLNAAPDDAMLEKALHDSHDREEGETFDS